MTVSNPAPGGGTSAPQTFTVKGAALTVTSITPNNANTGNASVSVTDLAGTNFYGTPTVQLKMTGQNSITATSVVLTGSTDIACNFDLTGAAAGSWDVYVANPNGQNATLSGGFTVNSNPAPTVTSITPNSGINNGTVGITDLAGTNFYGTPTVQLKMTGQTSITATSVVLTGSTDIACSFDLTGAAAGSWDVYVANPDGQGATLSGGFTVNNPALTVTSITPTNANSGKASVSVTDLAGTNFYGTPTVQLKMTGQTSITATNVTVVSSTQIACSFDLTGAAAGSWDVYVANPDGQNATLPAALRSTTRCPPSPPSPRPMPTVATPQFL